jgi:hypothetical protein
MKRIATILLLLLLTSLLPAQELVFFDGDVRVYERVGGDLFELQDSQDDLLTFGYVLDVNYVVRTRDGFAEILLPNGHMLKLDSDTEVELQSVLAQGASTGNDVVSVASGRLRSVVANLSGTGRGFNVRTPTAVGGVRGTDFVTQVGGGQEIIAVLEGQVRFAQNNGNAINLGANQFANALAASFAATQSQNIAQQFYGALQSLSNEIQEAQQEILAQLPQPLDQDEAEPEEEPAEQSAEEEPPADEQTEDESEESDGVEVESAEPVVVSPQPAANEQQIADEPGPVDNAVSNFMTGLTEILGLEIGSLTLEGTTYSKVIAQPTFQLGDLRAGLYLPVVYSGNLFDPSEWYRPQGNNEWSFGSDQDWETDPLAGITDLVGDLVLKIRFIEWGDQRDDFFFKVGNLNTLTLGHGLLMRNYANDTDFPAIRRVGFNIGIDFGGGGFELLTNDLTAPEIIGARIYARPVPNLPFAIGLSGVTDISPTGDLPATDENDVPVFALERSLDPLFLNLALDIDVPIIETDPLSVIAYGDVGGLLLYLRNGGGGLTSGFQWQALLDDSSGGTELRNYGIASGVMGNVTLLDYRVEFQLFNGLFEPAFYNGEYDRTRGEKVRQTVAYLQNPGADEYQSSTVGIYGEAGFSIFDAIRLDAGYRWPWSTDPNTGEIIIGDNDYLLASLMIEEGLLPLDITAGISYERTYFAPTLFGSAGFEGAQLFDEYTVLKGQVVYPVAPIMDIVGTVTTAVLRDGSGNIIYETRNGELRPKYGPVISIETRLGGAGF